MATASLAGLQAFVAEIGLQPIPSFANADVLNDPLDIYHSYLAENFQTLVECEPELVYSSIHPSNAIENGDLDIVLPQLKLTGAKPKELAGELIKKFPPHPLFAVPFKDNIHIRIFFQTRVLPRLLLPYILDRNTTYGTFKSHGLQDGPESSPKKVIVEFSSPNIAKEFTAAHLRSTILGGFVANMYEAMGYSVVRVNHLCDWGKSLALLFMGSQKYPSEQALEDQTDPFRYIHDLYTKMEKELEPELEAKKKARDEGQDPSALLALETQGLLGKRDLTCKLMEDGDPEAIELWKKSRDISIKYYADTYARLNINFDEYSGESKVCVDSEAVADVESILKEKGLYEEKDETWVIDFDKHVDVDKHGAKSRLGAPPLRDRNGCTTYLLRDIATVFDRLKTYSFDKMVYVACEHDVHFRQVFKAIELMGRADVAEKLQHITFPKGHTTHEGNAQLLGDILDQCESYMREAMTANPDRYPVEHGDAVANAMGVNSLVIQELWARRGHHVGLDFSLNLLTLTEGETGTNLQLAYARLCAAIAKIGMMPRLEELADIDYSSIAEIPWCELLRLIARYPEATHAAFKTPTLESGTILSYLFRLVEEMNGCLDEADQEESDGEGSAAASKYTARAVLYESVRQVLENGMRLLGATPISN